MKKKETSKKTLIIGSGILAVIILTLTLATTKPKPQPLIVTDGMQELTINKSEITKTASFFPYESNGTYMEIIAVRANDDTVRTALNTCQVCYSSGRGYYEQLGDKLICKNCGNQFTIDQIEVIKGGCNPVPILDEIKTEDDEIITIQPEDLVQFEPLFAKWRR